mgnify:FL=1
MASCTKVVLRAVKRLGSCRAPEEPAVSKGKTHLEAVDRVWGEWPRAIANGTRFADFDKPHI